MGIDLNGSDTFYFLGQEGVYIPVGETTDLTDIEFYDPGEKYVDRIFNDDDSAFASFEVKCRIDFYAWAIFSGLMHTVLETCPNKRVVHQIMHATKRKVKKKNLRRAIRILEGNDG